MENEQRGDLLITLTPEQWDHMKSKLQYMIQTFVKAGFQMVTFLIVHDVRFSYQEFRRYLREAEPWDQAGVLTMRMFRPEDGSAPRADVEWFVPLYPTLEEAFDVGLVDYPGLISGHEN